MAKHRDPVGIHAATRRAHSLLGDDGIAGVTGKSAALAQAWGDPDKEGNHIPFYQAIACDVALMAAGKETPFLSCLTAAVQAATPPVGIDGAQVLHALRIKTVPETLAEIGKEFGDYAGVVVKALHDGALSAREKQKLNKELDDIIDKARDAKRALR